MLGADWPSELLDHPEACEVWARRNSHLQFAVPGSAACISATAAGATFVSGTGSPSRTPGLGVLSGTYAMSAGGGTANGGGSSGGGGGLETSLLVLARFTKGGKRSV